MNTKNISTRTLGLVAVVTGAVAFCLLVVPYMLFPQFYVPKANATMGYTMPATSEGWAFMIAGLVLMFITIIFVKMYRSR